LFYDFPEVKAQSTAEPFSLIEWNTPRALTDLVHSSE
jgi:hypothetical protein